MFHSKENSRKSDDDVRSNQSFHSCGYFAPSELSGGPGRKDGLVLVLYWCFFSACLVINFGLEMYFMCGGQIVKDAGVT